VNLRGAPGVITRAKSRSAYIKLRICARKGSEGHPTMKINKTAIIIAKCPLTSGNCSKLPQCGKEGVAVYGMR